MSLFVQNPIIHSIFSPSTTYMNTFITHFPKAFSNTTEHIKRALCRRWDSKPGEGQAWKGGHSSRSQHQRGEKGEVRVGKSNTQKFSFGRTEGALRTRSSGETEWRGRSRDIYFKPELNNNYKRRETKRRIDLQKEQTKTPLNKTAKMTQTLSCFLSIRNRTGPGPNIYLGPSPEVRYSACNQIYWYSCWLSICSLIKATWHLRHRVKQMAAFSWTGL